MQRVVGARLGRPSRGRTVGSARARQYCAAGHSTGNDLNEHVPDPGGPRNNTADRPHAYQLVGLGDSLRPALYYYAPSLAAFLIKLIDLQRDIGGADQL